MLDRGRLQSKKISKTQSVLSQMNGSGASFDPQQLYVGPSDYVPWLRDNKVCFLRIEADQFGGVPMNVEVRLSVEDSPNSAGVMMDAVRAAKVALDRGLSGPIIEASAYLFKSPIRQFEDSEAREMLRRFAEPQLDIAGTVDEQSGNFLDSMRVLDGPVQESAVLLSKNMEGYSFANSALPGTKE